MDDVPPPLVCAGRAVDDAGRPYGPACGRRFRGPDYVNDGRGRPRASTTADQAERARAAGWSPTGPMCDRCRKPDPAIARGLTTTRRSST